ncbi:MAG: protein kinase domain-containing protein, partial [Planctomycetota bacterium]
MDSRDRIADIIAELHERRERGERIDPEQVIHAHPDLEDALRSHFEFANLLDDAVGDGELPKGLSMLARIERISGTHSRVLLRDPPDDESPLLRVPLGDDDQGTVDDSRYHIAGEIARGGVGVVYKARDKDLGRDVALKMLRTEHHGNRDVFARFVEEAQIGAQLQHPGIVPVYGLGLQPDGRPYFAMKLVKGRT